ncbi:hypothetical protein BDW02DRAFT_269806 [Decorospora gaudefroyi]|uniref:Uncharacterized protein n=1 Tax=Decorospora gaudefroyi TaxID=184978 RepID=A0A6A5KJK0_9PLEO|nr:hypothetical protein BDW02DRAFT_269806 [Decorospora gaudefroyi]
MEYQSRTPSPSLFLSVFLVDFAPPYLIPNPSTQLSSLSQFRPRARVPFRSVSFIRRSVNPPLTNKIQNSMYVCNYVSKLLIGFTLLTPYRLILCMYV